MASNMDARGRQQKNAKPRYACKYGDVCWDHTWAHRKEYWHPKEAKEGKAYWLKYEEAKQQEKDGTAWKYIPEKGWEAPVNDPAKAAEKDGQPDGTGTKALPPPPPPPKETKGPDPDAGVLVDKKMDGALVDAKTIGRQVTDSRSSAVYISDLPLNFHGGEESLHFALGDLFGQYGKIKKIELYMEEGVLETQNFKGEALVVYHQSKHTGKLCKGDPVWEACTDLDGKYRVLGYRHWRIRCEAAEWQKQGYDVKEKAKLHPCVQLDNLWEFNAGMPLSWFGEVQEAIRKHAAEHIQNPFVKVDPSEGSAIVWCKGAKDAMKFAGIMMKSYFLGRKVVATLCRKEKLVEETLPKLPKHKEFSMKAPGRLPELTMKLPSEQASNGNQEATGVVEETIGEGLENLTEAPAFDPNQAAPELTFRFSSGTKVVLKGLVSKPENNGKKAEVLEYLEDVGKYQLRLDDGDNPMIHLRRGARTVRVKPENVEAVQDEAMEEEVVDILGTTEDVEMVDDADDADVADDEATKAQNAAALMATGQSPIQPIYDPKVNGFQPTVCVDPALLPKRQNEEETVEVKRRESSRSRERRYKDRIDAVKARLESEKGPRPGWIVPSPAEMAAKTAAAGTTASCGAPLPKEPEESREELMKMSVSKLKELLKEFGKTARGCIEKRDFVDRLKPAPKTA